MLCRVALHCDHHMPRPWPAGRVSAGRQVGVPPMSRSCFSSAGSGPDRIIERLAGQSGGEDVTQEGHPGFGSANGSGCGVLWGL